MKVESVPNATAGVRCEVAAIGRVQFGKHIQVTIRRSGQGGGFAAGLWRVGSRHGELVASAWGETPESAGIALRSQLERRARVIGRR